MGLVFEIALAVGLVASTAVNLYLIGRWGGRVTEMDEDAHKAFSFVGDQLGTVLARVNAVESILLDDEDEEETEPVNPFEGLEVHVMDWPELPDDWAPLGFGRDFRVQPPQVLGIDFANGDDIGTKTTRYYDEG
jgi:hypothetical protein